MHCSHVKPEKTRLGETSGYLIMSAITFCGLTTTIRFSVMKNLCGFGFGTFSTTKGGKTCYPILDGTLLPISMSFVRGTCSIRMSLRFSFIM